MPARGAGTVPQKLEAAEDHVHEAVELRVPPAGSRRARRATCTVVGDCRAEAEGLVGDGAGAGLVVHDGGSAIAALATSASSAPDFRSLPFTSTSPGSCSVSPRGVRIVTSIDQAVVSSFQVSGSSLSSARWLRGHVAALRRHGRPVPLAVDGGGDDHALELDGRVAFVHEEDADLVAPRPPSTCSGSTSNTILPGSSAAWVAVFTTTSLRVLEPGRAPRRRGASRRWLPSSGRKRTSCPPDAAAAAVARVRAWIAVEAGPGRLRVLRVELQRLVVGRDGLVVVAGEQRVVRLRQELERPRGLGRGSGTGAVTGWRRAPRSAAGRLVAR